MSNPMTPTTTLTKETLAELMEALRSRIEVASTVCTHCGWVGQGTPRHNASGRDGWECPRCHYAVLEDFVRLSKSEVFALLDAVERFLCAKGLVEKQATDEGLWFLAATAPEAYLQDALRELHRAIEGDAALATRERREDDP